MRTYDAIKDKSLVVECRRCAYRSVMASDRFWPALAKVCGGDVDRMEDELRCSKCKGPSFIEVNEPLPPKVYTEGDYEIMGIIGDFRRAGRKRKLRKEG